MKYELADGAQIKGDPQIVGEAIEQIRKTEGGSFKLAAVVDAARSKESILHEEFEWDNKKAAECFRLNQAGNLVRGIRAVVEVPDRKEPVYVRAFVTTEPVKRGDHVGANYTSLKVALSDDEMRSSLISKAVDRLNEASSVLHNLECVANIGRSNDYVAMAIDELAAIK